MLKRKSTKPAPVCLAQIAKDFNFHSIEAKHYSLLFNQAAGPDLLETTPWQEFCQYMAEYHQVQALELSAVMSKLEQAA